MKLLEHIAQDIAEKTTEILGYSISITDKKGYIIGSTDRSRLGHFHKPSLEVIQEKRMVTCDIGLEDKPDNVLPGISVPLMINDKVIGILGIIGDPGDVLKYVHLVKNHVEMMCQEGFKKEMVYLESKMIEVFVQQIIHFENNEDNDQIVRYAQALDYDLDIHRACLLIDINTSKEKSPQQRGTMELYEKFSLPHLQREIIDYLNLIFKQSKDDIISLINVEQFIVIKAMKSEQAYTSFTNSLEKKLDKLNSFLQAKYNCFAAISNGGMNQGINGIYESYLNATKAMTVGKKTNKEPAIYHYHDWFITLELLHRELSMDIQTKFRNILQPLTELGNYETLSSTFVTYCKYNMNLSQTARNMYVHRNTVIYRLEKISELTSLKIDSFEHCLLLYMAIRCYEESSS